VVPDPSTFSLDWRRGEDRHPVELFTASSMKLHLLLMDRSNKIGGGKHGCRRNFTPELL